MPQHGIQSEPAVEPVQPVNTGVDVAESVQVKEVNIPKLPNELWKILILNLPPHILFKLRTVSRFFRDVVDDFARDWVLKYYPYFELWIDETESAENNLLRIPPFSPRDVVLSTFSPTAIWLAHGLVRYQRQMQLGLESQRAINPFNPQFNQGMKKYAPLDESGRASLEIPLQVLIDRRHNADSLDFLCYLISLIPENERQPFLESGMKKAVKHQDIAFFDGMLVLGGQAGSFVFPGFNIFSDHPNYNFILSLMDRGVDLTQTVRNARRSQAIYDPICYFLHHDFVLFSQHPNFESILGKAIVQRSGEKARLTCYLDHIDFGLDGEANAACKNIIRLLLKKIKWENTLFDNIRLCPNVLSVVLSHEEIIEEYGRFDFFDLLGFFDGFFLLHLSLLTPQAKKNINILLNTLIEGVQDDLESTVQLIKKIEEGRDLYCSYRLRTPGYTVESPESHLNCLFQDTRHLESLKNNLGRPYLKLALYLLAALCIAAAAAIIVGLMPALFPVVLTFLPSMWNTIILTTIMLGMINLATYCLGVGCLNGINEILALRKIEQYQAVIRPSRSECKQEISSASVEDEEFILGPAPAI